MVRNRTKSKKNRLELKTAITKYFLTDFNSFAVFWAVLKTFLFIFNRFLF